MSGSATIPLMIALPDLSFTDAYFEAMSGLTTTGFLAVAVPKATPRPIQEWVRGLMMPHSLQALADCTRAMATTDFRRELPRIRVPALVIHGTRDASAPFEATGRPTAALLPHARLEVYEGAPHGLFVTHQARLTGDLLAFARG